VFFWLLLKDRLSTRELLRRKNMVLEEYNCVLCHSAPEETLLHLFFHCPFAMACWNFLGLAHLILGDLQVTPSAFKDHLRIPIFMEIIICLCWSIWSAQNDSIFRNLQHSVMNCKHVFRRELALVKLRVKARYKPLFDSWLEVHV
jgi:hypothetical protein